MKQDIKDISEKELTKLYAEYQAGSAVPCRLSFIAKGAAFRVACRLRIFRGLEIPLEGLNECDL